MFPTGPALLRHRPPPGIDTLRRTVRRGLEAVPEARHRAMVASVLDAGLVEQAIARTESFDPSVDLARVRAHTDLLTAEFETFGVVVPAATTRNITLMRALMVPIADKTLSFAVDRIWVFVTNIDDVCSKDSAEAEAVLRAGMSPGAPGLAASPNARFIEHMFREIAGFCD